MSCKKVVIYVYLWITGVSMVHCSKILLAPFAYPSHINEHTDIGDALRQNGHQVDIMLPTSFPNIDKYRNDPNMKVLEYRVVHADMYTMDASETPMDTSIIGVPPMVDFRTNVEAFIAFCYNLLEDEHFLAEVEAQKYDLAVVDAFPSTRCHFILLYKLGIP